MTVLIVVYGAVAWGAGSALPWYGWIPLDIVFMGLFVGIVEGHWTRWRFRH